MQIANWREPIQALGVGEALVSVLDEKGAPTVVQKTMIRPPNSRMGPALPAERVALMGQSPVRGLYDTALDRESAFEVLKKARTAATAAEAEPEEPEVEAKPAARAPAARSANRQGMGETFAKSMLRTIGSQVGRELIRGVLGGLLGSSRPVRRRRR